MRESSIRVGVVGVGSMGSNHVRVYRELPGADLHGVADANGDRAADVAEQYGTTVVPYEELLQQVDAVSIAVPTRYHYELARAAIDRGVAVLVEKPFVANPTEGRRLVARAAAADVPLQVGHIERFNPAVEVLAEVVSGRDLIAVEARRLGPPVGRNVGDGVVLDLMIHDLDVLLSLVDSEVQHVDAAGTRDNQYVTANIGFENGTVSTLTASRLTQEKVRELSVTTEDSQVNLDYMDQSVLIHRSSTPAYVESNESVRYRNESVVERPMVESSEPLRRQLESFLHSVATGEEPVVTGEDGLAVLDIAREIDRLASEHAPDQLVNTA